MPPSAVEWVSMMKNRRFITGSERFGELGGSMRYGGSGVASFKGEVPFPILSMSLRLKRPGLNLSEKRKL